MNPFLFILLVICFSTIAVFLLSRLLWLIYRIRKDKEEAERHKNRILDVYKKLYKEYEKVCGPEWASNKAMELIKNLTRDKPSTTRIKSV